MKNTLAVSLVTVYLATACSPLVAASPAKTADNHKKRDSLYQCERQLNGLERKTVMAALESELGRSKDKLRMQGYEPPFYMSQSVQVTELKSVIGTYGSTSLSESKSVGVRSEVRVGSYGQEGMDYSSLGLPSDSSPHAIKRALWLASDKAIKGAEESFYKKKVEHISKVKDQEMEGIADFSKEKPSVCFGKDVKLKFDNLILEKLAKRVSKEFDDKDDILDSNVTIKGKKETTYFINTEGTKIIQPSTFYSVIIDAETMTDEGESLGTYNVLNYRTIREMPNEKMMVAFVDEVVKELRDLKKAPKLDPTAVPVILDSDNSGVFWHEVVGHRLEGERQISEHEGQTFKDKVGRKITSDLVTLVDDPTLAKFNDMYLNGHYHHDAEGVPAQKVTLIEKGMLKNYLMSRRPIPGFTNSNGHGRAGGSADPIARMGNTMLIPEKAVPFEKLKEQAKEEVIKQGKDFYLIFRQSQGGLTSTSAYGSFQAFKVIPKLTYKVDVKTGKETLVRPVEVIGTPLNMLDEIVAFGDDPEAWNGQCGAESGWVPVSVISPSMLVKRLEVQNATKSFWGILFGGATPPILPPPKP